MNNFTVSSVKKYLIFPVLAVVIILGTIGGCSDSNNGSTTVSPADADALLVGAHADDIRSDLGFALDLADYDGMTINHMIVDCLDIDTLTQDEKDALREAFESGLIVFAYESNEACVAKLFADIFDHPLIFDELQSLDLPNGSSHDIFAAELHGIHIWTHELVFGDTNEPMTDEGDVNPDQNGDGTDEDPLADLEFPFDPDFPLHDTFEVHSEAILEWIRAYPDRRDVLEAQGDVILTTAAELNLAESTSDSDPAISTRTSNPTGTLADIAASYIHTHTFHPRPPGGTDDHNNDAYTGTYQMTTYVWSITADGPAGIFSYAFIAQDFNLQSASLYRRTGSRDKGWYLRQFTNTNRLKSGSSYLTGNQATILDNDPQSVSAEQSSETQSTSFGVTGDISSDGPSLGASASWDNSVTIEKAEIAIDNLSLSSSTGNDASWRYTAKQPETRDNSAVCTWDHLSDPPALAKSNFQPTQSFIFRISPQFADTTMKLESRWAVSVERMTLNKCTKWFSCYSCGEQNWTYTDNQNKSPNQLASGNGLSATFNISFHIPALPN